MRLVFDDGTLLLEDAPESVPSAEWDDRVDEYRARAYHYRDICDWATEPDGQATLQESTATVAAFEDDARAYAEFHLTPSVAIEPRDYQREALSAWQANDRQGSVVPPTGSGKTFLAVQAIADAGVSTLVVVPTIDLMNQWHATLTNAFGDQLPEGVGVLGGGSHDVTDVTVTTYDSAYRYINEYGDQFGLLVVDEVHHLPAPTYQQIPEMMIAPYRLGLTATYERADGAHEKLEDLLGTVVYREEVDDLAGDYLSEYETIHLGVELTDEERTEYDEEYQMYRDYVDSHEFDLWKERGYQEFLKRTSYDPQGRRALIAKQRAEKIARTAEKKLDTLDNLLKRHYDDRTIIFTANNEFAYEISQEFVVPCITHQTETDERTEVLELFRSGEYSMLVTSQVLDEGIDVPAANVGIILSGSAPKRQYAQRLGRILRPTDDRQPARLYEIITEDTMETYVSERRRQGVLRMLTADLARSRAHEDSITPSFIDTDEQRYRDTAEELIRIFEEHLGEPKGELEDTIDQLTIADTDYKVVQGLAKLLKDECEFETVAPVEPREIRQALFEKANESYPIVRQPTLGEDTQKLEVYSSVAGQLGITLEECYRGMYADLEENKRLVWFGHRVADEYEGADDSTTTTRLTGDSEESYADDTMTIDWLLTRYNLALAQAVLYDATEMRVQVWDSFATVFSYVKLFGLMHRIYPIDSNGNRVASTDVADGYEAILNGAASLFSKSRKYGIRMANFLPALPLCDRWEMEADILDDENGSTSRTLSFELDHTDDLSSHYSAQREFDSDVERTLAQKWERANTDWELIREDDVLDLGAEVMLPDFAL